MYLLGRVSPPPRPLPLSRPPPPPVPSLASQRRLQIYCIIAAVALVQCSHRFSQKEDKETNNNATNTYTTWVDTQNTLYQKKKKKRTSDSHPFRITCEKSAVSLLESGEQRYIKVINNNNATNKYVHHLGGYSKYAIPRKRKDKKKKKKKKEEEEATVTHLELHAKRAQRVCSRAENSAI